MDHYADIPYLYPFRAWSGGFQPLRIHGPSGRTPELGTKELDPAQLEETFAACISAGAADTVTSAR